MIFKKVQLLPIKLYKLAGSYFRRLGFLINVPCFLFEENNE